MCNTLPPIRKQGVLFSIHLVLSQRSAHHIPVLCFQEH